MGLQPPAVGPGEVGRKPGDPGPGGDGASSSLAGTLPRAELERTRWGPAGAGRCHRAGGVARAARGGEAVLSGVLRAFPG